MPETLVDKTVMPEATPAEETTDKQAVETQETTAKPTEWQESPARTMPDAAYKGLQKKINKLETLIASLTESNAALELRMLKAGSFGEADTAEVARKEAGVEQIRQQSARDRAIERHNAIFEQMKATIKDSGLFEKGHDDPAFAAASQLFTDGDYDSAHAEITRVIATAAKERIKKFEKSDAKKKKIESGALNTDLGSGTAGPSSFTRSSLANYDVRGKTPQQMKDDTDRILAQLTRK